MRSSHRLSAYTNQWQWLLAVMVISLSFPQVEMLVMKALSLGLVKG